MTAKSVGSLVSLDVPIESPPDMRREVARRVDEVIGAVRPRWDPTAVRARATEVLGLCDEVERLKSGRDAAWDEVERLRSLCREARGTLRDIGEVVGDKGCSCECGHAHEEHDETCERCDMCLVSECLSTRLMDRLSVAGGEP